MSMSSPPEEDRAGLKVYSPSNSDFSAGTTDLRQHTPQWPMGTQLVYYRKIPSLHYNDPVYQSSLTSAWLNSERALELSMSLLLIGTTRNTFPPSSSTGGKYESRRRWSPTLQSTIKSLLDLAKETGSQDGDPHSSREAGAAWRRQKNLDPNSYSNLCLATRYPEAYLCTLRRQWKWQKPLLKYSLGIESHASSSQTMLEVRRRATPDQRDRGKIAWHHCTYDQEGNGLGTPGSLVPVAPHICAFTNRFGVG